MTSSLNLLREYLRLVLEGKVEDLVKQNPNVDVKSLADSDSTPTKKLLPWMIKQISRGADVEHVKSVASRFAKDGTRLKNKDINSYTEIDELESELDSLGASKRSETIQAKSGAVKIYEDNEHIVLRIDTKEAAQQYGKGTKWCITMEKEQHYEEYTSNNVLFYYVLRKEPINYNLDKIAVAITKEDGEISGIEIFDQTDKEINNDSFRTEILSSIEENALQQPDSVMYRIKNGGEYTTEELIHVWERITPNYNDSDYDTSKLMLLCGISFDGETYIPVSPLWEPKYLKALLPIEKDESLKEIISDIISGKAKVGDGRIRWRNELGKLHRDGDKPAVLYATGESSFYHNGIKLAKSER